MALAPIWCGHLDSNLNALLHENLEPPSLQFRHARTGCTPANFLYNGVNYIIGGSEHDVHRHKAGFGGLFKTDAFEKASG